MKSYTKNILALSLCKGIGAAFMKQNRSLIETYRDNIEMLSVLTPKINQLDFDENLIYAAEIIQQCKELNINMITFLDENYPKQLLEIKDPPAILYLKGNVSLIANAIAIIGTRHSSDLGNKIAGKLGEYFSKKYSICNGLVEGIDKHSILIVNDVLPNVIGVLSGGLNFEQTTSKITRELSSKVLQNNGLLISEYEPNKKEDQFSGSKASRIQAGISKALILVQSKVGGGSKYTLKAFSELNRPIGVIEFLNSDEYLSSKDFGGNRLLIKHKVDGIAKMCDVKKRECIRSTLIFPIGGTNDYKLVEEAVM